MARQRPAHVLAHEGRTMIAARRQRRDDPRRRGRVPQGHGDVTKPTLVPDTPDRGALEPPRELFFAPREELDQLRIVEAVTDSEVRIARGLRVLVPGTHQLAIVAAVDPVAHERAQRLRYR